MNTTIANDTHPTRVMMKVFLYYYAWDHIHVVSGNSVVFQRG